MIISLKKISLLLTLVGLLPGTPLAAQPSWTALVSAGIAAGSASLANLFTHARAKYNEPMSNERDSNPYYTKGNVAVVTGVGLGFMGWFVYRVRQHKNTRKIHTPVSTSSSSSSVSSDRTVSSTTTATAASSSSALPGVNLVRPAASSPSSTTPTAIDISSNSPTPALGHHPNSVTQPVRLSNTNVFKTILQNPTWLMDKASDTVPATSHSSSTSTASTENTSRALKPENTTSVEGQLTAITIEMANLAKEYKDLYANIRLMQSIASGDFNTSVEENRARTMKERYQVLNAKLQDLRR
jgi:cytoskeletal protein RodZ